MNCDRQHQLNSARLTERTVEFLTQNEKKNMYIKGVILVAIKHVQVNFKSKG